VIGVVGVGGSEAFGVAGAAAFFPLLRFGRSFVGLLFGAALLGGVGVGGCVLANDGDSPGACGRTGGCG
jgi:hypothetical protein